MADAIPPIGALRSPELSALLAACRAAPTDDLPRLVLADWLDEQDQPERAELIRVQCELARPTADSSRLARLKQREQELLRSHHEAWVGPLPPGIILPNRLQPIEVSLHRGLLRLNTGNTFLAILRNESFLNWLESPCFDWLELLQFRIHQVTEFTGRIFPKKLKGRLGLVIASAHRSDAEPQHYSVVGWDREGWRQLTQHENFACLRSLDVTAPNVAFLAQELLEAPLAEMVQLRVQNTQNQPVGLSEVLAAVPFPRLSSLSLGPLTAHDLRNLTRSPYLANLHHLDLSDSPIGDTGLKILLESEMADSLCDVSFPNKQITDRGIEILVDSGILGRMIGPRLNLMKNQIGDQGLACLAGCEHLARFRELVLRENLISDAGILALAQSPHVGHLEYLDFWRNRITDVGAFALANSPYLDKIVDLSLKENAITTVGRDALVTRFGERVKLSLD